MDQKQGKERAKNYYDQEAENYIKQYRDGYDKYPANSIRINFVIKRLKENKVRTVLDVGCGTCGPMIKLLREGFDVKGFDFSKEMVEIGRKELKNAGFNPDLVTMGDLENEKTLPKPGFDAVIALGVFPHIVHEKKALTNMRRMLNPNGIVFIEFRNDLFAAYTLNKYSVDFFLNRVIDFGSLPSKMKDELIDFYSEKLRVEKPTKSEGNRIEYSDILAKYRNPLSIGSELFDPCKLPIVRIHFYHFHALPPVFESKYPEIFRELSLKLEKTDNWRGYLMASAFVVEAKKSE